jgi:predicted ester cyclase
MKSFIYLSILILLLPLFGCDLSGKTEERNKAIVKQYFKELVSDHNYTNADKLLHPACIFYAGDEALPLKGLDFIKSFEQEDKKAFSFVEAVEEEMISEGNTVAVRWYIHGVHDLGEYQGIPAGNKKFKYDRMSFYKLEDGLIVEAYLVGNELLLMKQLGELPSE